MVSSRERYIQTILCSGPVPPPPKKKDMFTLLPLAVLLVTPVAFAIPAPRDGEGYAWKGVYSKMAIR